VSELRAACFGRDTSAGDWPTVSVVVPVRNEAPHLERAVTSILAQEYPRAFDVCLAIAPSDDGTESCAAVLSEGEPRVSVVANPAGVTPAGLNAAIAATTGEVVVRVDGHAELCSGYIRRAVETMCRTGAVNVGGMQVPKGETRFEEAVAAATTSWLGTGGARYRVGGVEGPVDTVYLGVFDRATGDAVGWFDESLIRNQDYEFNIRLRAAGGVVWFDPELAVSYRPRGSYQALARQYFEYGRWKVEVVGRHPDSLVARQAIPLVSTTVQLAALVVSTRRRAALAVPLGHVLTLGAVTAATVTGPARHRLRTAAVAWTMQQAWGLGACSGFVAQVARSRGGQPRRARSAGS
jgi:glycosyltransferase involved in cell wall biosynthesis